MKVFFDYQIFYLQKYGGISRYFIELANELNKLQNVSSKIIAPYHHNFYLEENESEAFYFKLKDISKKILSNKLYDNEQTVNESIAKYFCKNKQAVLHETYYSHRFKVACPKVITVHDMIYELFNRNQFGEQEIVRNKKEAIKEAHKIIVVSENTRQDLIKLYPDVANKTEVVYHGVQQSNYPLINPFQANKPFILHVGRRDWYKNFSHLLSVFAKLKNINTAFNIICFGGGEPNDEEKLLIQNLELKHKIQFIQGKDEVLISLYKAAQALVYISDYEGFGMPILEAMALSCPVVCSNVSALPEVYGNAAFAIDPKSSDQLSQALDKILFDADFKKEQIALGLKNASKFTWENCAKNTLKVYQSLL